MSPASTNIISRIAGVEKEMLIQYDQPRLIPPPYEPQEYERPSTQASIRPSTREWMARGRDFAASTATRGSSSVRRRFQHDTIVSRRPQISAPSNFIHIQPDTQRSERFRPLELSIYMGDSQLSPILSHFGEVEASPSYPPAAILHTRSESALSNFTIPRKPVMFPKVSVGRLESSLPDLPVDEKTASHKPQDLSYARPASLSTQDLLTALQEQLPKPPPLARMRAKTSPVQMLHSPQSEQCIRVKSILQERQDLDERLRDIETIIEERQSVYMGGSSNSVVSTEAQSQPRNLLRIDMVKLTPTDPLPLPRPSPLGPSALPASDRRPKTAPSPPVRIPIRAKSFSDASAVFRTSHPIPSSIRSKSSAHHVHSPPPPPPPLPLIFHPTTPRPPLRKKKSFSLVSKWLFPGPDSSSTPQSFSSESITNTPAPVAARAGFYQCVDMGQVRRASSSVNSFSDASEEGNAYMGTEPTSWTPDSSPGRPVERDGDVFLEEGGIGNLMSERLGKPVDRLEQMPRGSAVGVAF